MATQPLAAQQLTPYSRSRVLGLWLLATVPMALVTWVVAPWLIPRIAWPAAAAYLALTSVVMLWQGTLALWALRREGVPLRWQAVRRRTWLQMPRHPSTDEPRRSRFVWLVPCVPLALLPLLVGNLFTASWGRRGAIARTGWRWRSARARARASCSSRSSASFRSPSRPWVSRRSFLTSRDVPPRRISAPTAAPPGRRCRLAPRAIRSAATCGPATSRRSTCALRRETRGAFPSTIAPRGRPQIAGPEGSTRRRFWRRTRTPASASGSFTRKA